MVHDPVPVGVRGDVGPLEGVLHEVVELGQAQLGERLAPDGHRAGHALLGETAL